MARPSLLVKCPGSTATWRVGTRARAGAGGELSATCPSCGNGLRLREGKGRLELVPGRTTDPARLHTIETGSTFVGLRG